MNKELEALILAYEAVSAARDIQAEELWHRVPSPLVQPSK